MFTVNLYNFWLSIATVFKYLNMSKNIDQGKTLLVTQMFLDPAIRAEGKEMFMVFNSATK